MLLRLFLCLLFLNAVPSLAHDPFRGSTNPEEQHYREEKEQVDLLRAKREVLSQSHKEELEQLDAEIESKNAALVKFVRSDWVAVVDAARSELAKKKIDLRFMTLRQGKKILKELAAEADELNRHAAEGNDARLLVNYTQALLVNDEMIRMAQVLESKPLGGARVLSSVAQTTGIIAGMVHWLTLTSPATWLFLPFASIMGIAASAWNAADERIVGHPDAKDPRVMETALNPTGLFVEKMLRRLQNSFALHDGYLKKFYLGKMKTLDREKLLQSSNILQLPAPNPGDDHVPSTALVVASSAVDCNSLLDERVELLRSLTRQKP